MAVPRQQAWARAVQLPGTGAPRASTLLEQGKTLTRDSSDTVQMYTCREKRAAQSRCGPKGAHFSLSGRSFGHRGSHLKASRESRPANQARCSQEPAGCSDAVRTRWALTAGAGYESPPASRSRLQLVEAVLCPLDGEEAHVTQGLGKAG